MFLIYEHQAVLLNLVFSLQLYYNFSVITIYLETRL